MLFRVLLCLIYLITLEISVAASFEHNNDSNICSQEKESEKNLNCDYHCISQSLIDDIWLNPEKNNFDDISKLNIQLIKSYSYFHLTIFPRKTSPPISFLI